MTTYYQQNRDKIAKVLCDFRDKIESKDYIKVADALIEVGFIDMQIVFDILLDYCVYLKSDKQGMLMEAFRKIYKITLSPKEYKNGI